MSLEYNNISEERIMRYEEFYNKNRTYNILIIRLRTLPLYQNYFFKELFFIIGRVPRKISHFSKD